MQSKQETHCNNREDLVNLSFTLNVSVFSEAYLEPIRTSMMNLLRKYFCKKALIIYTQLSSKYGSAFCIACLVYAFAADEASFLELNPFLH